VVKDARVKGTKATGLGVHYQVIEQAFALH
jgi:hypothetical protein